MCGGEGGGGGGGGAYIRRFMVFFEILVEYRYVIIRSRPVEDHMLTVITVLADFSNTGTHFPKLLHNHKVHNYYS